jgi:transcriptional regulator with XRE-family HTH domain
MKNLDDELHIVSLVCANVKETAGLSVREIAKRMGIPGHQAQVQRIIDEKHPHNMTLKTLFRFADACGYVCNISFKKKKEGICPTP